MNFELESLDEFETELKRIEEFFRIRRKKSSIYLSQFDVPAGLEEYLLQHGYSEVKGEEGVFWGLSIDELKSRETVEGLEIKECKTTDDLAQYLIAAKNGYDDFDYTPYAASMSKLFKTSLDGVSQLHFVGFMNGLPVASGSIGVLFDTAIWINAAVIPAYRKRGINTAMLTHAIKEANKLGATKFYYSTDVDNEGSIKSGTNIGFTEVIRQRMFTKDVS
jgi:GNAT superfamily N-acetyltransferase